MHSGGIDFLQGMKHLDFDLNTDDPIQRAILDRESEGVSDRMERFLVPLIRRYAISLGKQANRLAVLDSGCGAGLSVDLLHAQGMDAWGIDSGAGRPTGSGFPATSPTSSFRLMRCTFPLPMPHSMWCCRAVWSSI